MACHVTIKKPRPGSNPPPPPPPAVKPAPPPNPPPGRPSSVRVVTEQDVRTFREVYTRGCAHFYTENMKIAEALEAVFKNKA